MNGCSVSILVSLSIGQVDQWIEQCRPGETIQLYYISKFWHRMGVSYVKPFAQQQNVQAQGHGTQQLPAKKFYVSSVEA